MGVETALLAVGASSKFAAVASTLSTGLSLFSGISSIMGGMQSRNEAGVQSELAMQQAESRAIEQERLSAREARIEQDASEDARKKQKVAYLASGVSLAGSPLLVMEETRRKGLENVDEVLKAGEAGANVARTEGRIVAEQAKSTGRKEFSSGISSGLQSIAKAF